MKTSLTDLSSIAGSNRVGEKTGTACAHSEYRNSLLVGAEFRYGRAKIDWLRRRRYESVIVETIKEACEAVETVVCDVILSRNQLPDGSGFKLVERLTGLPVTVFILVPVENGCIWLPALLRGISCWGTAALRPKEFVQLLEGVLAANHSES